MPAGVQRHTTTSPLVLTGAIVGSADAMTRPIRLYAGRNPTMPSSRPALKPALDNGSGRLCELAIEQATTEADREVILGDGTVPSPLTRWLLASEAGTEAPGRRHWPAAA
jgi:hypothetical protein